MNTLSLLTTLAVAGVTCGCTQEVGVITRATPLTTAETALAFHAPTKPADPYWSNPDDTGVDPGSVYLVLGNFAPACDRPYVDRGYDLCPPVGLGLGADWMIEIAIPPSLLHPGNISLGDPLLWNHLRMRLPPDAVPEKACGRIIDGPYFTEGTMDILSVGPDSIQVTFADTYAPNVYVENFVMKNGVSVPDLPLDDQHVISGNTFTASMCP
jgi:hypothetical protein